MIATNSNGEYRTTDTSLAAYLIQEGFELLIIEYSDKPNGKKQGTFVFQENNQLRHCVSVYNRGEATINLALYEHAKSSLIDRIMRGLP